MSEVPVYVVDEIELHPGKLEPFLASLAADYEPAAVERGMQRVHTWVTPPLELAEGGTQVLVVWQVAGVPGFWGSRGGADADVLGFWERCDAEYARSRSRRYAADATNLAALDAAGRQYA